MAAIFGSLKVHILTYPVYLIFPERRNYRVQLVIVTFQQQQKLVTIIQSCRTCNPLIIYAPQLTNTITSTLA